MRSSITVPAYLEARSKDELREMMRLVQIKFGMKLHFFDFSFSQNKWVCWYEVSLTQELEKKANGN